MLKKLSTDMQEGFKKVATKDELKEELKNVATKDELKEVKEVTTNVSAELKGLSTKVEKIGVIWENQTRLAVSRQFGESFSKSMKVKSMIDAVNLVLKNDGTIEPSARLDKTFEASHAVSKYIEDKNVMLRYFNTIVNEWIENDKTNQARDEFDRLKDKIYYVNPVQKEEIVAKNDNGRNVKSVEERFGLIADGVGRLIGVIDKLKLSESDLIERKHPVNESFRSKVNIIKSDLEHLQKNPARLTKCESSGIILLTFEALSKFADSSKGISLSDVLKRTRHKYYCNLPSDLEIDVRGSISMAQKHCTISVGEIKSNPDDIATAKSQLFTQLMFMKLIVSMLYKQVDTWVLKGFIFSDFSEEQRKDDGKSAHDIGFYLIGGSK